MTKIKCEHVTVGSEDWDSPRSETCIYRDEGGYCTLDEITISTAENYYPICENIVKREIKNE